jgi:hypothetical protein
MGRPTLALAALLLAMVPRQAPAQERLERFSGTARSPGGAVSYLEEHVVRRAGERLLGAVTTYTDEAGRILAVLRTDFSADPFAPSYEFEDLRHGEREAVEVGPEAVRLAAPGRMRTLPRPAERGPRLVTGQGLDRLVQASLEALAGGQELAVAYAIPARLDTFRFRVRALEPRPEEAVLRVRVEIASALLRLFAPSLEVDYDRTTRRLLRYRGVSNLADGQGRRQDVEIRYQYPEAGLAGTEVSRDGT